MKTFKRTLSCFLALLMIFGSFSVLSYATLNDGNENSAEFYTRFFVNGVETDTVENGDTVKARVYIATDYHIGSTTFFWVYSKNFMELDLTGVSGDSSGYDATSVFNQSETSIPVTNNLGGMFVYNTELTEGSVAHDHVLDGYLTEDFFEDKGWIAFAIQSGTPAILTTDNGNDDKDDDHFIEFTFKVKEDAEGEGFLYIPDGSLMTPTNKYAYTMIQRSKSETSFAVNVSEKASRMLYDISLQDKNTIKLAAAEATKYAVTYSYTGDVPEGFETTVPAATEAEEGATISKPVVENIPDGYTLTWTATGATDNGDGTFTVGAGAVAFLGTWTKTAPETYAVTYTYANEAPAGAAAAPAAGTVNAGGTIAAPSTDAPAGYTLTWAVTGATKNDDGSYTAGANDVEFVGTWAAIDYNVTYSYANEAPAGAAAAPAAGTVNAGGTIAAPSTDAPAGYTLTWAVTGATKNDDGSYTAGANDVEFVGTWATVEYDVTYSYANEAPAGAAAAPAAGKTTVGATIAAPSTAAPDGYTLTWAVTGATKNDDGSYTAGANDVEFVGTWAKKSYTITYYLSEQDKADGKVYDTQTFEFGEAVAAIEDPKVAGKAFDAWDIDVPSTMPAENLEAVAIFSDYIVTFYDVFGDELTDYTMTAVSEITEADLPSAEDATAGEDVTFVEWQVDGVKLATPYSVEGDVDVYPYCTVDVVYYSIYEGEDSENNVVHKEYTFKYGHEITEDDLADLGTPVRTGYRLDDDMPWDNDLLYAIVEANTYAVANWIANEYDATFTAGDGAFAEGTVTTVKATYGKAIEFTAEPTREGYSFKGWTDVEGGAALDELVMDAEGKTFYPVFVMNGSADFLVELYLMNTEGKYDATPAETLYESGLIGVTAYADHEGCQQYVDDWFSADTSEDADNVYSNVIEEDGSTTLKLYYKRAQYDVVIDGAAAVKVYHGATVTAPSTSANTPAGYELASWNNGAYTMGQEIEVTGDLTLTPDFVAGTSTYTIKTYTMGLDGEYGDAAETTDTYTTDETVTYTAPAVEGFKADKDSYSVKVTGDNKAVIEVYYARNQYDVTIDGVASKVFHGAKITAPETTTATVPEGFTFTGWNNGAYAKGQEIEVTEALTLTPDIVANDATDYSVEIYLQDAEGNYAETPSKVETESGKTGEEITIAHADYAQEDYYLADDAEANEFTGTIAGDGSLVLKLYFKRATYDVIVDGEVVAEDVIHGAEVTLPEESDNIDEGNELDGWTDGKNTYEPGETIVVEGALDLTPVQKPSNATKYTISIYMMDTDGNDYVGTSTVSYGTTGATQTIVPDYSREGFTVNTEKSKLTGTIAADGSLVLSVYYDRNLYTATFDGVDYQVYYGASLPEVEPAAQEGKEFDAWTPAVPATMPADDLEFTSTWTDVMYKIIYIINGTEEEYEYAAGAAVTPRENPTVPGMTFIKWNKTIPETMPAEDVIIVAEFEAAVFKVTFVDADGKVFDEKAVQYGDTIVLPASNPTKEYHVFKGWIDVPETMPAANITIYPDFERVPVRLVAAEGSTTQIDRTNMIITGLKTKFSDAKADNYLAIEGDGYYTLTPVEGYTGYYGTGAKVEVYDNADTSAPIEVFYIVIYGDVNGDSAVNSLDGSLVEDESMYVSSWSRGDTKDELKVMAADLNKDGKVTANDANDIVNTALGITSIDQVTGTVIR